ncbi:MAG: hypothetical protein ACE5JN_03755 [Candidatus Methylomirabilia bacterium]
MRTPIKPLPAAIDRWTDRVRWLRWLDAAAVWILLWAGTALLLPDAGGTAQATLAAALAAIGASFPPVRAWWRPVSGWVAVVVSRPLRAGDRAWQVRPGEAELVLVTARRGLRVVIAHAAQGPAEGIAVRRTRVFLFPADAL